MALLNRDKVQYNEGDTARYKSALGFDCLVVIEGSSYSPQTGKLSYFIESIDTQPAIKAFVSAAQLVPVDTSEHFHFPSEQELADLVGGEK